MTDLQSLPAELMQVYLRIVRHTVRTLSNHPLFEDIHAEARIEALRALQKLEPDDALQAHGLVKVAAHHGAVRFLRSPTNDFRRYTSNAVPVPPRVEIDALPDWRRDWLVGAEPDFVPPLIESLWRRSLWEQARSFLREREWRDLERYLEEENLRPVAQRYGLDPGNYQKQFQAMLNRFRRVIGARLWQDNTLQKEPLPPADLNLDPVDEWRRLAFDWYLNEYGYVYRGRGPGGGSGGPICLHREIWGDAHGPEPRGTVVAFANGNRLDLRRSNLVLESLNRRKHAHAKERYQEDRERICERNRAYYAANRTKLRVQQNAGRARRLSEQR